MHLIDFPCAVLNVFLEKTLEIIFITTCLCVFMFCSQKVFLFCEIILVFVIYWFLIKNLRYVDVNVCLHCGITSPSD